MVTRTARAVALVAAGMTRRAAAREAGIHVDWLRRAMKARGLPPGKPGRKPKDVK